jgi:hypothetical protein
MPGIVDVAERVNVCNLYFGANGIHLFTFMMIAIFLCIYVAMVNLWHYLVAMQQCMLKRISGAACERVVCNLIYALDTLNYRKADSRKKLVTIINLRRLPM